MKTPDKATLGRPTRLVLPPPQKLMQYIDQSPMSPRYVQDEDGEGIEIYLGNSGVFHLYFSAQEAVDIFRALFPSSISEDRKRSLAATLKMLQKMRDYSWLAIFRQRTDNSPKEYITLIRPSRRQAGNYLSIWPASEVEIHPLSNHIYSHVTDGILVLVVSEKNLGILQLRDNGGYILVRGASAAQYDRLTNGQINSYIYLGLTPELA